MPVTIDEIQQYESELRDYTRDAGSGFKDAVCREAESVLYGMELCVPRTSGRFGPSVKEGLDVVMSEDEMNLWKSWEDPSTRQIEALAGPLENDEMVRAWFDEKLWAPYRKIALEKAHRVYKPASIYNSRSNTAVHFAPQAPAVNSRVEYYYGDVTPRADLASTATVQTQPQSPDRRAIVEEMNRRIDLRRPKLANTPGMVGRERESSPESAVYRREERRYVERERSPSPLYDTESERSKKKAILREKTPSPVYSDREHVSARTLKIVRQRSPAFGENPDLSTADRLKPQLSNRKSTVEDHPEHGEMGLGKSDKVDKHGRIPEASSGSNTAAEVKLQSPERRATVEDHPEDRKMALVEVDKVRKPGVILGVDSELSAADQFEPQSPDRRATVEDYLEVESMAHKKTDGVPKPSVIPRVAFDSSAADELKPPSPDRRATVDDYAETESSETGSYETEALDEFSTALTVRRMPQKLYTLEPARLRLLIAYSIGERYTFTRRVLQLFSREFNLSFKHIQKLSENCRYVDSVEDLQYWNDGRQEYTLTQWSQPQDYTLPTVVTRHDPETNISHALIIIHDPDKDTEADWTGDLMDMFAHRASYADQPWFTDITVCAMLVTSFNRFFSFNRDILIKHKNELGLNNSCDPFDADFISIVKELQRMHDVRANVVEKLYSNLMMLTKLETLSAKSADIVDGIRKRRRQENMVRDLSVYLEGVKHSYRRQTYIVDCDVAVTNSINQLVSNYMAVKETRVTSKLAEASHSLAQAAKKDSSAMKSIAVLTMLFLPATAVAAIFDTPFFEWFEDDETSKLIVRDLAVFWAIAASLTIGLMVIWFIIIRPEDEWIAKARKWIKKSQNEVENKVLEVRASRLLAKTKRSSTGDMVEDSDDGVSLSDDETSVANDGASMISILTTSSDPKNAGERDLIYINGEDAARDRHLNFITNGEDPNFTPKLFKARAATSRSMDTSLKRRNTLNDDASDPSVLSKPLSSRVSTIRGTKPPLRRGSTLKAGEVFVPRPSRSSTKSQEEDFVPKFLTPSSRTSTFLSFRPILKRTSMKYITEHPHTYYEPAGPPEQQLDVDLEMCGTPPKMSTDTGSRPGSACQDRDRARRSAMISQGRGSGSSGRSGHVSFEKPKRKNTLLWSSMSRDYESRKSDEVDVQEPHPDLESFHAKNEESHEENEREQVPKLGSNTATADFADSKLGRTRTALDTSRKEKAESAERAAEKAAEKE